MNRYTQPLKALFEQHRNPALALKMQQYMKGQYSYFGIPSPLRRDILRVFVAQHGLPEPGQCYEVTKYCWQQPEREYQYFIMEILGKMAKKAEPGRIELYEYMAMNKSWWDTIDYIASNLVGVHFQKYPEQIQPQTERWMSTGNMWLQRVSLLFQLKYKSKTDVELMTRYIEKLLGSRAFFINKAIGWILREYSKTNPDWVVNYVNQNKHQLAGLSQREALKWMDKKGKL